VWNGIGLNTEGLASQRIECFQRCFWDFFVVDEFLGVLDVRQDLFDFQAFGFCDEVSVHFVYRTFKVEHLDFDFALEVL